MTDQLSTLPDRSVLVRVSPEILALMKDGEFEPVVILSVRDLGDGTHEMILREPPREAPKSTPLHELVDLCREQGLALDFALYGPDIAPLGDDTLSRYLGGARITGHKGDPMDVIRSAIRARRDAARREGDER
jgi:hypothetical protein